MGETGKPPIQHIVVLAVAMGSLVVLLPLAILFFTFLGGLTALDTGFCSDEPSAAICSPGTFDLVVYVLPIVGGVVGLLVGVVGGVLAIQRHRRPYPWIALAWALAVAACVPAFVAVVGVL